MELLKISKLSKYYGRKQALNSVSLSLNGGKIVGLLGPNGSGKTTMLKLINGLLFPNEGEILIEVKTPVLDKGQGVFPSRQGIYPQVDEDI